MNIEKVVFDNFSLDEGAKVKKERLPFPRS